MANQGLAESFDIKGYPTLILLRGGVRIADHSGPRTFDALVDFVESSRSETDMRLEQGLPLASPPRAKKGAPPRPKLAARLLSKAQTLLATDDPLSSGLLAGVVMLAGAAGIGLCCIATLFLTTKPSQR